MGVRKPETCWAVNKCQDNKLEELFYLVGDLFESFGLCSLLQRHSQDAVILLNTSADETAFQSKIRGVSLMSFLFWSIRFCISVSVLSQPICMELDLYKVLEQEQQHRQCTYNMALRRVLVTAVVMENNNYYIFWMCFCSLIYPACKANAPYCVDVFGLSGSSTFFPHYPIKGTIFGGGGGIEYKMYVSTFSTTFVWNNSYYK
jgi:hypothetical protein